MPGKTSALLSELNFEQFRCYDNQLTTIHVAVWQVYVALKPVIHQPDSVWMHHARGEATACSIAASNSRTQMGALGFSMHFGTCMSIGRIRNSLSLS